MKTCVNRRFDPSACISFCSSHSFSLKDELILRRALYKLYHIEESLKANASEIQKQRRTLNGLREDQRRQQQALDRARTEQARAKTEVSREEKKLKRAEKVLEAKVCAEPCCRFGLEIC